MNCVEKDNSSNKNVKMKQTKKQKITKKLSKKFNNLSEENKATLKIVSIYLMVALIFVIAMQIILALVGKNILNLNRLADLHISAFLIVTVCLLYILIYKQLRINSLKNKIQAKEEEYKFVTNTTTDGLWKWNLETNEYYGDYKWLKKLGYEENEIPSCMARWIDKIYLNDIDFAVKALDDYLERQIPRFNIECRLGNKKGTWNWVSVKGQAVWDNTGKPKRMIGTISDITERKLTELAVIESEKKFRSLFDNSIDGIALLELNEDGTLGHHIEINDLISKGIGFTKDELLNMTPYDIRLKGRLVNVARKLERAIACGKTTTEVSFNNKSGREAYFEIKNHVFVLNEKKVVLLIGRNITDRKIAEKELKESEERSRRLIKLSPDAIFVHTEEKILFSNEAGFKLLGFKTLEDFTDKNIMEFVYPDNYQIICRQFDKMKKMKEEKLVTETKIICADGTVADIEGISNNIIYNGKPAILSMVRDITERKEAEKTLRKLMRENKKLLEESLEINRLKTEFFCNISHEFKTPLNVILGVEQILNDYKSDNEIRIDNKKFDGYIHILQQNCYRLLRLINNLIDINRIDSGFLKMKFRNYNIISVIENITLSIISFTENKGISLTFDTEVEEKIISCDADKIERIMLNILSNAIKYTSSGESIFVDTYDKDDHIIISVKDTGRGIPKDKLKLIFERFRQADSSLRRPNEGSGIGLSLVKSLIEMHQGEIWVESEYGVGTTFFIKLPAKKVEVESVKESEEMYYDNNNDNLVERIHIEFSDIYSD